MTKLVGGSAGAFAVTATVIATVYVPRWLGRVIAMPVRRPVTPTPA